MVLESIEQLEAQLSTLRDKRAQVRIHFCINEKFIVLCTFF